MILNFQSCFYTIDRCCKHDCLSIASSISGSEMSSNANSGGGGGGSGDDDSLLSDLLSMTSLEEAEDRRRRPTTNQVRKDYPHFS
jgi:hypothetical protein